MERGNGNGINFSEGVWCGDSSLVELISIDPTTLDQPHVKVNEFITQDKSWNFSKLGSFLPGTVIRKICAIPLPFNDVLDSICWGLTRSV